MPIHDCGGSCSSSSDPFSRVRDQIQSQAICPVFRDQLTLTTRQRLTLLLTCSIRSRREWSAWLALCCARGSWWFLGRHEDLHLGKGEGQEAEILQQPASGR